MGRSSQQTTHGWTVKAAFSDSAKGRMAVAPAAAAAPFAANFWAAPAAAAAPPDCATDTPAAALAERPCVALAAPAPAPAAAAAGCAAPAPTTDRADPAKVRAEGTGGDASAATDLPAWSTEWGGVTF